MAPEWEARSKRIYGVVCVVCVWCRLYFFEGFFFVEGGWGNEAWSLRRLFSPLHLGCSIYANILQETCRVINKRRIDDERARYFFRTRKSSQIRRFNRRSAVALVGLEARSNGPLSWQTARGDQQRYPSPCSCFPLLKKILCSIENTDEAETGAPLPLINHPYS